MANPVELVRLFKNVSPRAAQALLGVQKLEKNVASAAKLSQTMGNSEIGKLLGGLAKVGENIAGSSGVISVTAQKAAKNSDATILRVVVKKGKEVAAKVAATISYRSTKVGGKVAGESFHYVNKVMTNAEKFEALAKKLGVDINTARKRLQAAGGVFVKDENVLSDIILGKYALVKPKAGMPNTMSISEFDPVPLDEYFSRGINRAFCSEPVPIYARSAKQWMHNPDMKNLFVRERSHSHIDSSNPEKGFDRFYITEF